MPRPLEALGDAFVTAGFGVKGSVSPTIFEGNDTDIPASTQAGPVLISILQTGGPEDDETHNGDRVAHPSFQITCRHSRYPTADTLAIAIHDWCRAQRNQTLGGRFWLWIRPLHKPFGRGKDASQRSLITFNVRTAVRD